MGAVFPGLRNMHARREARTKAGTRRIPCLMPGEYGFNQKDAAYHPVVLAVDTSGRYQVGFITTGKYLLTKH